MSMIEISCPACKQAYRIASENQGKTVRCKQCGQTFAANPSPHYLEADDEAWLAPSGDMASTPDVPPRGPNPPVRPESRAAGTEPASPHRTRVYRSPPGKRGQSDEIDYVIHGDDTQYVEVALDPGETVIAESGSMMYMSPGIEMQTVFGEPSQSGGGFWGKMMSAGKRVLTGESLFMTTFTNVHGRDQEFVAFAAPFMGRITPMHLADLGGELICQKDAFLCGAKGIQVSIAFQKKFGAGLFGGEGFIMQRLRGDGIALVHAGGALMHRQLAAGETLRLDTGCLMAMGPTVEYDIQMIGGVKNSLFGGEGLFLATVVGPGPVWLQSLPFSRLAGRIYAAAPQAGGARREEGSVLGGLGNMLLGSDE
jgi:predicted Zn finger-like uncharacterized protein